MADPLERIRKLLALATNNTFQEEARSAAHKAALLIKEHGIVLYMPGTAPGPTPRQPFTPPPRPGPPMTEHRVITSQYAGVCGECAKPYQIGHRIAWMRGAPTYHESCYLRRRAGVA